MHMLYLLTVFLYHQLDSEFSYNNNAHVDDLSRPSSVSNLENLLAKLGGPSTVNPSLTYPGHSASVPPPPISHTTSTGSVASAATVVPSPQSITMQSLFAANSSNSVSSANPQIASTNGIKRTSTGVAFLDTLFASASASPALGHPNFNSKHSFSLVADAAPARYTPGEPQRGSAIRRTKVKESESIPILSPLPQVLSQDVISGLLGMPPSRTHSSASTSSVYNNGTGTTQANGKRYSSHPSSREGDNEAGEEDESDGAGSASTLLDPEDDPQAVWVDKGTHSAPQEYDEEEKGSPDRYPSQSSFLMPSISYPSVSTPGSPRTVVNGDRTPRAPFTINSLLDSVSARTAGASDHGFIRAAPSSTSTIRPSKASVAANNLAKAMGRPLVPYTTESELWPYAKPPVDDTDQEEEDIVELNFEDTRVLSDGRALEELLQKKKKAAVRDPAPAGEVNGHATDESAGKERRKGREIKIKISRKDRELQREKERKEIEDGWDFPAMSYAAPSASAPSEIVAAPVVAPSLQEAPKPNGVHKKPKTSTEATDNDKLDQGLARETLVHAVLPRVDSRVTMGKKEFVREVLTLVHVCFLYY